MGFSKVIRVSRFSSLYGHKKCGNYIIFHFRNILIKNNLLDNSWLKSLMNDASSNLITTSAWLCGSSSLIFSCTLSLVMSLDARIIAPGISWISNSGIRITVRECHAKHVWLCFAKYLKIAAYMILNTVKPKCKRHGNYLILSVSSIIKHPLIAIPSKWKKNVYKNDVYHCN